ncbi:MAG: hypothetical protein GX173_11540 [Ruminococcaceae bacterium]|nr:hypothetical protein [Oscillospiraceae bacterium]
MKKCILLFLTVVLVLSLMACSSAPTSGTSDNLEGDLEDILASVYENADLDGYFAEFVVDGLYVQEINEENIEYHLGSKAITYKEAIASEPVMSTSAYSLCLVRVEEGAEIESIMSEIKDNVDPMKWVCVGVDPANIFVDHVGDVIILIMSDEQGDKLMDSFLALGA